MTKSRGWVCPDCGARLDEPKLHECRHGQVCVPGFVGGLPSSHRDECAECAKGVLVWNAEGPRAEPSGFVKRKLEAEAVAERERERAYEAPEIVRERRLSKSREREEQRERAREVAKTYARAALETLRKGVG